MQQKLMGFVGTMAKVQAKGDEPRVGWVSESSQRRIALRFEEDPKLEAGKLYLVEFHGRQTTVAFAAKFAVSTRTQVYDLVRSGSLTGGQGVDLEFFDVEYEFVVKSEFRFRPTRQAFRLAVWDVKAHLEFFSAQEEVTVLIVGEEKVGCYANMEFEPGSNHVMTIATSSGEVRFNAEVADCEALGESGGHFRLNLDIRPIGRLDAGRWKQFIEQQSLAA